MSKENENIDNAIRDAFNEESLSAPKGLWENISKTSMLSSEEKRIFEAYEPSTDNWSKLQKQVIINEVWEDLSKEIDKRNRRVLPFWFIDATLGLFVVILMLFQIEQARYIRDSYPITKIKVDQQDAAQNKVNLAHRKASLKTDVYKNYETSLLEDVDQNKKNSFKTKKKKHSSITQSRLEKPGLKTILATKIDSTFDKSTFDQSIKRLPIRKVTPSAIGDISNNYDNQESNQNLFGFGLQLEGGNSWIINNTVRNSLDSKSLSRTKFSGGWGLGITAKYDFNNRFGIKAEYIFLSEHQQNYLKFENGLLNTYKIKLQLNKIRVSGSYSFLETKNTYTDVHFGAFFSLLTDKQTSISENLQKNLAPSIFKNTDFGFTLGIDKHKQINDDFNFFYGAFSDIGITNLRSSKKVKTPAKYNYTNTLIVGIRTGIQFNW